MGQVVPFIARVRDSGDWSATERARLQELADRLAAGGVHVDVIFGATDEGDPWCVVTDEGGDVLIHVARIDGKFVVHSAVDDAVNESADLHTALRDRLAATEEAVAPPSATILPFGFTARQGQTFLALVAAAAFFYETAAIGETAEAGELIQELPPADPTPPADADAPAQERELAAQGVSLQPTNAGAPPPALASAPPPAAPTAPVDDAPPPVVEAQAAPPAATAEIVLAAPAPAEPPAMIRGTAGDDLLVGTSADEHILGGDGGDTLSGGGGHDTLDGGAGDDRIEITAETVAIGGAGADSFVIQAPVCLGRPDTLLGVILDFNDADGDRLFSFTGSAIRFAARLPAPGDKSTHPTDGDLTGQLKPNPPPTDPEAGAGGDFGPTLVRPPLTRVDIDLDGDGVADGFILINPRGAPLEPNDPPAGDPSIEDPPIVVVGQTFGFGDPVG